MIQKIPSLSAKRTVLDKATVHHDNQTFYFPISKRKNRENPQNTEKSEKLQSQKNQGESETEIRKIGKSVSKSLLRKNTKNLLSQPRWGGAC